MCPIQLGNHLVMGVLYNHKPIQLGSHVIMGVLYDHKPNHQCRHGLGFLA
jgi:hypothetical protein